MSTPISIDTLLSEGTCYTCFAPTPVPEIAILSLWGRIAGGGSAPCVPLAAPVATAATDFFLSDFVANWTAVVGAVTYYVDVSTDPLFGSFYSIYNGFPVSAPTTQLAVSVDTAETMYYRVRASALASGDLSCSSANSNVITAFYPPNNLIVWTAADFGVWQDVGATIPCTAGTTCYVWENRGNAAPVTFTMPTVGKRPTFQTAGGSNGQPRLVFNASRMDIAINVGLPYTIAIAFKATSASVPASLLWNAGGAAVQFGLTDATAKFAYLNAGNQITSVTDLGNAPCQVMAQAVLASGFVKANATKLAGNCGGASLINPSLFGYASGGTFDVIGDVYEVMIWGAILTAGEETLIYNYLKAKYSLP